MHGAGTQIRTADLLITNQLLYQLSYPGTKQRIINCAHAQVHLSRQAIHAAKGRMHPP